MNILSIFFFFCAGFFLRECSQVRDEVVQSFLLGGLESGLVMVMTRLSLMQRPLSRRLRRGRLQQLCDI